MSVAKLARLAAAGLVVLTAATAGAQIDPFYLELERDAFEAAARGDGPQAARLYRIACFGMLDEPARLAACTVRLALAQRLAGDRDGFRDSFARLATVEERFQGLSRAELTAVERADFARIAGAWLPAEALAAIPAVAAQVRENRATAAKTAPVERGRRGREAAKPKLDQAAEGAPVQATQPAADATSELGASSAADPAVAASAALEPGAPPLTPAEEAQLAAARALAAGRPERAEIDAALGPLIELADRRPADPEVLRLVGDLAYRAGLWSVCADYYGRAGDPGVDAPLDRFYVAVCLFETGRREAAADLLRPVADRLRRSPFVDGYLARILGPPPAVP